ncbi:MAG: hypothetical protein WC625_03165 [Caldisericia bacterium]
MPVTRPQHVDLVFRILAADPCVTLDTIDEQHAGELLTIWHQGMVNQVVNLNVDYRIESWLYREYPGIRPNQEKSIGLQVQMSVARLTPNVKRVTPRLVYEGSNAINYTYLHSVGIMLGQNLVRDYTDSAIVELGKRLVGLVDPSWNPLLVKLSRLRRIVEQSVNGRGQDSTNIATHHAQEAHRHI